MGNVCPCPKRNKKKEYPYDVHEETFQMEDNIQNIGEHSPKQEQHHETNILTEELRVSDDTHQHEEEKLTKSIDSITVQSNKMEHFESASSNQIDPKSEQEPQSLPLVEQHSLPVATSSLEKEPVAEPKTESKPSFAANILKPKAVKKKYNPDDYRFLGETGSFKVKTIDSIKEQQYNIDGCRDCTFFIFDITANLYIDDCDNCTIFIAPCESTIFVRSCKRMTLIAATKQFRTYECHDSTFILYCKSQPVIESSSELRFSPFRCPLYAELPQQFSKKKLEPWNNHWSEIHNFTKKEGEKHHSLHLNIPLDIDWGKAFEMANLQMLEGSNPVPVILGDLPYESKAEILILLHKTITNEQAIAKLDGIPILKGFQGVVAGEGKEEKRAILIDALDSIPEKFEELGIIYSNPAEVATNSAKYFISFGDQHVIVMTQNQLSGAFCSEIPHYFGFEKMQKSSLNNERKSRINQKYNEFIVYDVAQIKCRQLLKMKFHCN